ncbi:MAG: hypothetical protein A2X47_08645 [Lentisphaerae bacterium GWF2_38_69]|nr:MAG: hypothetical protein A2X47_08645 [Lentisphaerae bacterium GWF2_38_69]
MSKCLYIGLILFFSALLQIIFGNTHLIIPLVTLSIFYLTIVFGWEEGIISAVLSGILLDILYGRTFFLSSIVGIAAVFLAMIWLYKGEPGIILLQMIPSGLISLLYILPYSYYTFHVTEYGFLLALENIGLLIISCAISTIIFPLLIKLLDIINAPLGFDLYKTSQKKIIKH